MTDSTVAPDYAPEIVMDALEGESGRVDLPVAAEHVLRPATLDDWTADYGGH